MACSGCLESRCKGALCTFGSSYNSSNSGMSGGYQEGNRCYSGNNENNYGGNL